MEVEQERTEKRLSHFLPLLLASLMVSEGEEDTDRPCEKLPLEVICIGRKGREKTCLKCAA